MLFFRLVNRHHNHLNRSEFRRKDESVVIAVSHDERTHQTCGNAPRSCPDILLIALFVGEQHIESLGKILSEEVGSSCLKGLAVLHHSLNGEGVECSCKPLVRRLVSDDDRKRHGIAREVRIDIHHLLCLLLGLLACRVRSVSLLPEEFCGTEEKPRPHLPAHDVRPLVAENRKVTPRFNPSLVGVPDDGLRSRTDDEFLFEFCGRIHNHACSIRVFHQTVMRHHGALFRKSLHVLGLPAEERLRNEKREICVLMPCFLEFPVQNMLHLFPDCIAVRLDYHTSSDCGTLRQISLHHKVVIPLRVILRPFCNFLCHIYI